MGWIQREVLKDDDGNYYDNDKLTIDNDESHWKDENRLTDLKYSWRVAR